MVQRPYASFGDPLYQNLLRIGVPAGSPICLLGHLHVDRVADMQYTMLILQALTKLHGVGRTEEDNRLIAYM